MYRPKTQLRTAQTCYVCAETMPAGTQGVCYAPKRGKWRHDSCRSDLTPTG